MSLEVDECYFPPDGFPLALCLTQLTSLRLVGGRCTRLPPGISQLQSLQVGAMEERAVEGALVLFVAAWLLLSG